MLNRLICKFIGHKINPFSIVEYGMKYPIKCSRCNNEIENELLEKLWKENKCSGDSQYSVEQLKKAMRNYSNENDQYSYNVFPYLWEGGFNKFIK